MLPHRLTAATVIRLLRNGILALVYLDVHGKMEIEGDILCEMLASRCWIVLDVAYG
jgi:hypothetical protein